MAPLDGKWFSGKADLPLVIAENLVTASRGQPANATLGRNGWDGKVIAGIGLELSSDNRTVKYGQFFMRGQLSEELGEIQASRLWSKAAKDALVRIKFPHGGEFDFSDGTLTSDYLEGDSVQLSVEREEQQIPKEEWARIGIQKFSLRLVAHIDKTSNKTEPKIKYTVLFFPALKEDMEELSDAAQGTAWPGLKILEGNARFFPRAPEGGWGCPIYPLLCTGTPLTQLQVIPPGEHLRYAIGKIMETARLPVPCANSGTMRKKWEKLQDDPDSYEERVPMVVWPAQQEPGNTTG
jgi:hypothetical protein